MSQGLLGAPGGSSLVVNVSSIMASHSDESVSAVTPGAFSYRWVWSGVTNRLVGGGCV